MGSKRLVWHGYQLRAISDVLADLWHALFMDPG